MFVLMRMPTVAGMITTACRSFLLGGSMIVAIEQSIIRRVSEDTTIKSILPTLMSKLTYARDPKYTSRVHGNEREDHPLSTALLAFRGLRCLP